MADAMLTKSRKMGFVLLQRLMSAILELRSNWTHVEMFPATACQYSMSALNELLIFLNARTDALTSDIPSFPFTTDECDMFINVLQCRKVTGNVSDSYVTTYVAKLWERIAHHCFSTHFGEDRCCVSSIHSVVEAQAGERGPTLMTASKALFNVPAEYAERLQRFGWTILFIALLGAHVYLRESTTCYCTANDIVDNVCKILPNMRM
jgi:hypothetical protein